MIFLKGKEEFVLAFLFSCTALTACILLYLHDNISLIYFGDAVSHIVRARQFIDSQQPGIVNIGTVWLPLPHLLLIPFVAFDMLFYSGIAGAAIGIPFLVGTTLLLFSIMHSLTGSRPIAFFLALLFGMNPNVVYIALTPMNEITFLFFVTLGAFALVKWLSTEKDGWMIVCTSAILAATLCRYESWLLAPFVSILALHGGIRLWKKGMKPAAIRMGMIGGICWLGIIFWLCWNYVQYGDALKFAHWSSSPGMSASVVRDRPQDIFFIFGNALLWIFGPMMVGAGVLVFTVMKKISAAKEQWLILLFFSLPVVFVISALLIGFTKVDQWWWNWRFVLTCGLFLLIASALSLKELFRRVQPTIVRGLVLTCFVVMPIVQMTVPSVGVAIFKDAAKTFDSRSRSAAALGGEIQKGYRGGSIALLSGYGVGQRIMISSRLPLKSFNVMYFSDDSTFAVSDRYLVLGKDRTLESLEFSRYWIVNKETLLRSYRICVEDSFFVLLERKEE